MWERVFWVGHFPIPTTPQCPLFCCRGVASWGKTSVVLAEKLVGNFKNVLHEFPIIGKDGKYEPFAFTYSMMAALNMSSVDVNAIRPMGNLLRIRNSCMFTLLAEHLTLFVSTNSHTVLEVMPASHLKKPDSEHARIPCPQEVS